jgi:hypothetical protein
LELKASTLSASGRLPFRVQSLADPAKDHVSWDEQAWRIEADVLDTRGPKPETITLILEHDFRDLAHPRRQRPGDDPDAGIVDRAARGGGRHPGGARRRALAPGDQGAFAEPPARRRSKERSL